MNKLVKGTDIITFGSQKGEQFFWLYLLHISYLEWLIENTEFCFANLSDFYNYGKIKRFKDSLSQEKKNLIVSEIKKNTALQKAPNSKLMTIQNINTLIVEGHITKNDFDEVDYVFSDFLVKKNQEKLNDSKPYLDAAYVIPKVYEHNFFCEIVNNEYTSSKKKL